MSSFDIKELDNLEKITVDEKEYVVSDLPPNLQELVSMYDGYRQELHDTRLNMQYELIKAEAAVNQCGQLIAAGINRMEKGEETASDIQSQVVESAAATTEKTGTVQ